MSTKITSETKINLGALIQANREKNLIWEVFACNNDRIKYWVIRSPYRGGWGREYETSLTGFVGHYLLNP